MRNVAEGKRVSADNKTTSARRLGARMMWLALMVTTPAWHRSKHRSFVSKACCLRTALSTRLPCRVLRLPSLCRYNNTHPIPPQKIPLGRKNKGTACCVLALLKMSSFLSHVDAATARAVSAAAQRLRLVPLSLLSDPAGRGREAVRVVVFAARVETERGAKAPALGRLCDRRPRAICRPTRCGTPWPAAGCRS